ncbi:YicC/YloC family endoribonuclease [Roseovarius litorisediminis]|uniref:YicC/YloC family endoribonuclease n=1 Tax=Roseovarius litorisediminis TaxID=1312363 RepID=UPI000A26F941|nr:YicC/YloC family endoribonuclease [Roseovarius litorisediminis]
MLHSMTAFASATGAHDGYSWTWDLRSVNGKGLDLRLRAPDWIDGLEAGLRARLGKALNRGNVTLSLRLLAEDQGSTQRINDVQLDSVLAAMAQIETRAMDMGLSLAPANAADVLSVRGVLESGAADQDTSALASALLADFETLLQGFIAMRASEGTALAGVLSAQLDVIAHLTDQAAETAETRKADMALNFRNALQRVLDNTDSGDEGRIAQEIAMLAVKADVTEEIDRLRAHVGAARDLLAKGSPIGRKLDFLSQEFNREANTLCAKAQNTALTTIGLELKTVIDQMREQVQNVE